jgi:hypothetical protein
MGKRIGLLVGTLLFLACNDRERVPVERDPRPDFGRPGGGPIAFAGAAATMPPARPVDAGAGVPVPPSSGPGTPTSPPPMTVDASMGPTGNGYPFFPCEKNPGASPPVATLDLLLVLDDGASMQAARDALRAALPGFVEQLTHGEGAFSDVNAGVISADMGAIGAMAAGCRGLGDDGVLHDMADPSASECGDVLPRVASYREGMVERDAFAAQLSCLAAVPTGTCWLRQPLEAGLKALWPSLDREADGQPLPQSRVQFVGDGAGRATFGHGDVENAGLVHERTLSVIAVLVVTNGDDCSTTNAELAVDASGDPAPAGESPEARCAAHASDLFPTQRYVNGLRALRPGREHLVVFGTLAGIPTSVDPAAIQWSDDVARADLYAALAAPLGMGQPCASATVEAAGAVRMLEVARDFRESGFIASICNDDYAPSLERFAATLRRAGTLGSHCGVRE